MWFGSIPGNGTNYSLKTQRIMDTKLTEKQRELLSKIQRDICLAKCNADALELGLLNGRAKVQWFDSTYQILYTALYNAKRLCETI